MGCPSTTNPMPIETKALIFKVIMNVNEFVDKC